MDDIVNKRKIRTHTERILRRHALTPEQLELILRQVAGYYSEGRFDWVNDDDPRYGARPVASGTRRILVG